MKKAQRADDLCLLAWAVLKLPMAAANGLGVDEAHYALYGQRWALSYFDHPPLVGWISGLFQFLLGSSELVVRLPAILAGLATGLMMTRLLRQAGFSDWSTRVGTLALHLAPLIQGLWLMFLPDTLVLLTATWLLWWLLRAQPRPHLRHWIELGFILGSAGLSKYTAVLVAIGLLGLLLKERKQWEWTWRGIGISVAIALVLVSPVLIWNAQNNWLSFGYQTRRVSGTEVNWRLPVQFLLGQVLGFGFPILLAWYSVLASGTWKRLRFWTLALVLPTTSFCLYSSLRQDVLPHWNLLSQGLILPVGWALVAEKHAALLRWQKGVLALQATILALAFFELIFKVTPFQDYVSPYADLTGWQEISEKLRPWVSEEPTAVAVTNWTQGSRAGFYLGGLGPVFVLDDRYDQFDLWELPQQKPKRVLLLAFRGFPALEKVAWSRCDQWTELAKMPLRSSTHIANEVSIYECKQFKW